MSPLPKLASAIAAIVVSVIVRKRARRGRRSKSEKARTKTRKASKADELGAFVSDDEDALPNVVASSPESPEGGRLRGLKFVIKDIFDVRGRTTGFGSPAWKSTHQPARRNAECIEWLANAGAQAVGITTLDELAYAINGENVHYGTPVNPNARQCIPGGSSSGSAVACAGKLRDCDFALGTDTGGSVRVPASYCGVFGIRTSHDSISMKGVQPLAPSFDTVGWFARSIDILQRVGDVLLPEPDAHAPTQPSKWYLLEDAVSDKRTSPHAQCAAVAAVSALREVAPRTLRRINFSETLLASCPKFAALVGNQEDSGLECLREMVRVLMGAEIWENLSQWYSEEKPALGRPIKARIEAASQFSAQQIDTFKAVREEVREEVDRLLDGGGVFVLPTTPGVAPKRGQSDQATDSWRQKCFELLCISSLCGLPQVSIPLGTSGSHGPQGLSLIGGYQTDKMLISAARSLIPEISELYPDILENELLRLNPPPVPGESEKEQGNSALKAGKYQEALEYYSVAIGKNPKSAVFVANRAMVHLKLGNYELAEEDCTTAIKLDKSYVKAYLRRAAARSVGGNYLESLVDYEDALRLEPNNADAKREVDRMKRIIGMADPGIDDTDL